MTQRPALFSFLLGGIAAVGFAPLGLWPVTLGCLAAWMLLVHQAPTRKAALWRGWLFGFSHFAIGNNWIAKAFSFQDAMPHALGSIAPALLALYLAIFPMLAATVAWKLRRPVIDASYVLIFATAWIATEYLRGTLFTGYPWNPLSEIWLPLRHVSSLLSWVGTYAMSGLAVLYAGALLILISRWRTAKFGWTGVALVMFSAVLTIFSFSAPTAAPSAATAPRIRVVQPNAADEQRPRDDYAETNLQALVRLSGKPGPAPRLVVWPEGALRYLPESGYPFQYYAETPGTVRRRIAAVLGPRDVVLTGGNALNFDAADAITSATNSIFAIDARARILGRYDKAHLVPFGEYLPARPLLSAIGLSRLVPGDFDFAPGHGADGLDLPAFGRVGFQLCYEIIFSGEVVQSGHRPALLFQPSNDSWYGYWGQSEHLAQARMRAIEEGLPVIRATPTGISAIIDAHGRILASIPANTAGAIELPIPRAAPPTLFARVGNAMAFLIGIMLALSAFALRRLAR
ncbi:apolipoprotein N-acyltransferase [Sphingomonas glacialis]|uniref:Apolipoprotein N-acyltransferase n=1 Tax=Sphingomonas glacialis TaxID=658225 RepID=A0A502FJY1_9SPHN|nr:apolipoprotein N-acyltransferase [Sphingomonas glacialis]TPG49788.1 apolipoprotein N-acyltransferase [Sphingomonas glacialis]